MKHRIAVALLIVSTLVFAQEPPPPEKEKPVAEPVEFVSHHKITIGSEVLNYSAVAGEIFLKDQEGTPQASIFTIAYLKEGVADPKTRPVTFLFNGGPGSSAVWLHLGAFGPKRLAFSNDAVIPGAPPFELTDNPDTLLRYSDLVFVDPVGTGYSRALGKKKDSEFWGVDEDSASIAQFIRSYLTKNKRWNSPKFIAGESYGTIRASVLIRDLELKLLDSVAFDGVILLSTALDVRTFMTAGPGNELPYVTNLPTFAATAYYHNALPAKTADLDTFLREARVFAGGEYLAALFQGDSLPSDRVDQIAAKLNHFTGLSVEYLKRTRLRIDSNRFLKELLRARGQTIAIHDTRFLGKDPDDAGEAVQFDPFLFGIAGPFVTTINSYLSGDLKVKMERPYVVFSLEASGSWKRAGNNTSAFDGFLYTAQYLAQAAATNKDFRVFVASGLHDLATAFYATEYIFDHSGIPKDRVTLKNYFGGHMMYMYAPSSKQMAEDLRVFIQGK